MHNLKQNVKASLSLFLNFFVCSRHGSSMFVTHLLFCKHVILYILYILYTCVMQCSVISLYVVGFRVFTRLQLWKSGRLMNTVNCNSIALALYEIGFMRKKKFIDLYLKTCFLHSSPDAFPKGRVSTPELLPLQPSALTLQAAQQLKISPRFSFPCTIFRR